MVAVKPTQAGDPYLRDVRCIYQAPPSTPFSPSLCPDMDARQLAPYDAVYFECSRAPR
jgi:hypothetical protein